MGAMYDRISAKSEFQKVTPLQVAREADTEIELLKQIIKNLEDRIYKLEPKPEYYGGYFG